MGREVKRVPLDFKWELNKVWKGFISPYKTKKCESCDGTGLNDKTRKLAEEWYSSDNYKWVYKEDGSRYNDNAWCYHLEEPEIKALVKEGRLMDFTHTWEKGKGWIEKNPKVMPIPEQINEWAKHGMGHDSINRYICIESKAKRLGFYGYCKKCRGEGFVYVDKNSKGLAEKWKPIEPPKGIGYQMWETVSEGSPISPVMETPEELAQWLADNQASACGDETANYKQWLAMIKVGDAPCMIMDDKGIRSGVAAVAENNK